MTRLSILDLAPIVEGGTVAAAVRNTQEVARHAERLGYHRYWLAEHHNMPGIASAATSVLLGQVGAVTERIRIGAGGIMLPNHAPLLIAEQFGTLSALFPGRIDLGLGRAPGTDPVTARALRRDPRLAAEAFPHDVVELLGYFDPAEDAGMGTVRAIPGEGESVEAWILGSSLFGAQLAAALGLPYAFASHFAPAHLDAAIRIYRDRFTPSARLAEPYVMLGVNTIVAEDEETARLYATSLTKTFVRLRRGHPGRLPAPDLAFDATLAPAERAQLDAMFRCSFVGTATQVVQGLRAFIEQTGADELITVSHIHDHGARLHSMALLAQEAGLDGAA